MESTPTVLHTTTVFLLIERHLVCINIFIDEYPQTRLRLDMKHVETRALYIRFALKKIQIWLRPDEYSTKTYSGRDFHRLIRTTLSQLPENFHRRRGAINHSFVYSSGIVVTSGPAIT